MEEEKQTGFYQVKEYHIVGDGATNNTKAIAKLISLVEKNGGGTIFFPAGVYVTGSIELKSNMTLYLDAGAVLLGSEEMEDYPVFDTDQIPGWEGRSRKAIITAFDSHHVSVIGRGLIDGRGKNWWRWATDGTLKEIRPRTIQLISCSNVRIEGITIHNSPMWTIHPVCCDNVTVTGVTIQNPWNSPNTDGINPESCSNVHISDCHIDVGDDCITLKSGTQNDSFQRLRPCENITITNCTMINGHGGVVIGSEMSGGVRNVTISNCVFHGTDRGIRVKTRRKRGGTVEDIRINTIIMTDVFCPIVINGFYRCGTKPEEYEALFTRERLPLTEDTPVFRNIYISNITARNVTSCAAIFYGIPESPITGVSIDHFVVEMKEGEVEPQQPAMAYGLEDMAKKGIKLFHVEDVTLRDIRISVQEDSALMLEDGKDVSIDSIFVRSPAEGQPVIKLQDVCNAYIAGGIGISRDLVEEIRCTDVKIRD